MLTDSNDCSGQSCSSRCSSLAHPTQASRSWLVVALIVGAAALGCGGGDDDKKSGSDTSPAGASGEGGASGSSGASGDTAGASGGGGSGPVGPQRVSCGDNTCYPPTNPLTGLLGNLGDLGNLGNLIPMAYACCLDEGAGTCGVSPSMNGACEARAMPDSRCPGVSLGALGAAASGGMMAGCCIDDKCGQDGTMFGRGCVENTQASAMLQAIPLIGTLAQLPGALACDRPMDQSDRDAGVDTEDAGR